MAEPVGSGLDEYYRRNGYGSGRQVFRSPIEGSLSIPSGSGYLSGGLCILYWLYTSYRFCA